MMIKRKKNLVKSLCLSSMPILLCCSNKGCGKNKCSKENRETQLVEAMTGSVQKPASTKENRETQLVEAMTGSVQKPASTKENRETQLVEAMTGSVQKPASTAEDIIDSIVEKYKHLSYRYGTSEDTVVQYAITYKELIKNLLECIQKMKYLVEAKKSKKDCMVEVQPMLNKIDECSKRVKEQAQEFFREIQEFGISIRLNTGQKYNHEELLSMVFEEIAATSSDLSTQKIAREVAGLLRNLEQITKKIGQEYWQQRKKMRLAHSDLNL